MALLNRVVLVWNGPQVVGGGVTVLHYNGDAGTPPIAAIATALTAQSKLIPSGVTVQVPGNGDVIEDSTGTLVDVWAAAGGATIAGNGSAQCAAGVGANISWLTPAIVGGRRLRGRTFIVPLALRDPGSGDEFYDTDGTLGTVCRGRITTLATDLLAAGPLAVWHRPTTKGGSDGTSAICSGSRVPDRVSTLRSRRY